MNSATTSISSGSDFPTLGTPVGFYERTGALYHYARGAPPKRLFWTAVPGGRWRIDWQRTNRGYLKRGTRQE